MKLIEELNELVAQWRERAETRDFEEGDSFHSFADELEELIKNHEARVEHIESLHQLRVKLLQKYKLTSKEKKALEEIDNALHLLEPLVGMIDSRASQELTASLLKAFHQQP